MANIILANFRKTLHDNIWKLPQLKFGIRILQKKLYGYTERNHKNEDEIFKYGLD